MMVLPCYKITGAVPADSLCRFIMCYFRLLAANPNDGYSIGALPYSVQSCFIQFVYLFQLTTFQKFAYSQPFV